MMLVGNDMKERMNSLGLSVEELAEESFMDEKDVQLILENKVPYEQVDEFEFSLLCSVLHCKPEYFLNSSIRKKDLLFNSMNRGNDDIKSKQAKVRIQDFMNDFAFLNETIQSMEQGEI